MKRIFAPWRMKYIGQSNFNDESCFLCDKYQADIAEDKSNLVLYRGETAYVLMNLYPYTNGHTMIAPIRHIGNYTQLTTDEINEITILSQMTILAIDDVMSPHGYNIGFNIGRVAGAGCDTHVHQHIVPRWNGDTNFMPVLSNVRIISEALEDTYNKIKPAMMKHVQKNI